MLRCALPVRACASAPRPPQAERGVRPAGLASRRAALLAPPATLVAAAAPPAARAEAEALEQPLPLKVAKLGGILLAADLVTAAVLGKSVLGLLRPKPEGADGEEKDWKERLADRLLGSSAEPSSRPPPLADLPEPERATAAGVKLRPLSPASAAREALLARVRAAEPVGTFAEVLRVVDDAYSFSPVAFSTGVVDGRADPGQVDNMAGGASCSLHLRRSDSRGGRYNSERGRCQGARLCGAALVEQGADAAAVFRTLG